MANNLRCGSLGTRQSFLKGIKKELGIESDGKDKLVEKFKEKAEKLTMPDAVKKVFEEVCVGLLFSSLELYIIGLSL